MNRNELIKEIRKNQRKINRSYKAYKKELKGQNSGFLSSMEARFSQITGSKKGRMKDSLPLGDLSKMNKKRLTTLLFAQKDYIESLYFTKKRRRELKNKKKATLEERFGISLTNNQYKNLINFFNANLSVYQELTETKDFGSEQILELIEEGINAKKLVDVFLMIQKKSLYDIKKGHWRVFVQELAQGDIKNERKLLEIYQRHKS